MIVLRVEFEPPETDAGTKASEALTLATEVNVAVKFTHEGVEHTAQPGGSFTGLVHRLHGEEDTA